MKNSNQSFLTKLHGRYIDTYDIRRIIEVKPVFYSELEPETQINIIDIDDINTQINLDMVTTKLLIEKLQSIYFYNINKESK